MNPLTILAKLADLIGAEPLLQRLLLASLEAAVLAVVVALLVRLSRLRSARVISLLWMIVLLKPVVSLTLGSLVPVVHLQAAIGATDEPPEVAGGITPAPPAGAEHSYGPFGGIVGPEADLAAAGIVQQAPMPTTLPEPAVEPAFAEVSAGQVLVVVWLAGVVAALGYHFWSRLRLRSVIRRSRPASEPVADRYRALCSQIGLAHTPRLLITEDLESPAIAGAMRSTVLLPAWLIADGEGDKLDWSIRHELTHYRWLDPWGVLVGDIALILFWFHPAVWWAGRRLVEAMELACDRAMLQGPADAADYAEQLFRMLQNLRQRRRPAIGGGLFATRTQVGRRIAALLETPFSTKPQLTLLSATGLVLAAVAALAFGGSIGLGVSAPETKPAATGQRILHFPKDRSLGALYVPLAGGEREYLGEAQEDVAVPAGKPVQLVVSEKSCGDLSPLARLAPDDLDELVLNSLPITESCMLHIGRLTGLKALYLSWSKMSDAGLRHLRGMQSLEQLFLPDGVTNAGMVHIGQLRSLKTLRFGSNRVSNKGLAQLENLKNLEDLSLGSTAMDQAGPRLPSLMTGDVLVHVARLPRLRALDLWGDFNDEGLEHLAECRSLRTLHPASITDAGLAKISRLTWLEDLDLANKEVTDRGLVHLRSMRSLKNLDISWHPNVRKVDPSNPPITDAGVAPLAEIRTLESLKLPGTGITDATLANLGNLDRLKSLIVLAAADGPLTDAGLKHLERLRGLETFHVGGRGITAAGISSLAKLPALQHLLLMVPAANGEALAAIARIQSLESLWLFAENWVGNSALNRLSAMPNLASLEAFNVRRDGDALNLTDLPRLQRLDLICAPGSTLEDEDLACLERLKGLKRLSVGGVDIDAISDAGMGRLAGLTLLEDVGIGGLGITDRGLRYLADRHRIWRLNVRGHFTDEGLRHLEGLTALSTLSVYSADSISPAAVQRLRSRLPNLRNPIIEGNRILAASGAARKPSRIGDVAMPFAETTLDGKKIRLEDYRGKTVLLYFWGTWCAPCVAGTPGLKKFHEAMSARYKDFALISLSMDDSEAKLRDFVKQQDLPWPQVRIGLHSRIAYYFGFDGSAPHYILVGPDGKIVSVDEMNYGKIEAAVAESLRTKRPTSAEGRSASVRRPPATISTADSVAEPAASVSDSVHPIAGVALVAASAEDSLPVGQNIDGATPPQAVGGGIWPEVPSSLPAATAPASQGSVADVAEPRQMRVHDVTDIVTKPGLYGSKAYTPRAFGAAGSTGQSSTQLASPSKPAPEEQSEQHTQALADLVQYIRQQVPSEPWDKGSQIRPWRSSDEKTATDIVKGDVLIITASPLGHHKVRELFVGLREAGKSGILLNVALLRLSEADVEKARRILDLGRIARPVHLLNSPKAPFLDPVAGTLADPARAEQILQLAGTASMRELGTSAASGILSLTPMHLTNGQEAVTTGTFDHGVAAADAQGKPEVMRRMEAAKPRVSVWVRATIVPENHRSDPGQDKIISLMIEPTFTQLLYMTQMPGKKDQLPGERVQVTLPTTRALTALTHVAMPADKTLVVTWKTEPADPRNPDGPKVGFVLVVTPKIIEAPV